jgi:hypothetical protein
VASTAAADDWASPLERWRAATAAAPAALPPGDAAIAAALLIGDLDGLSDAQRTRYARAGVSHVLSISGLHVGLVAAAAYALIRRLLARSERLVLTISVPKVAVAASLAPLALYAAIAGSNVATVRAEVMASSSPPASSSTGRANGSRRCPPRPPAFCSSARRRGGHLVPALVRRRAGDRARRAARHRVVGRVRRRT